LNGYRLYRLLATALIITGGLLALSGCGGLFGKQSGTGPVGVGNASLDFGQVVIGSTKTLSDTVTNNNSSSVTINSVQGLGSGFQVSGVTFPLTLVAGQTVSFNVQFQPASPGNPTITITFQDPNSQVLATLSATGKAVTIGQLTPSPSQISFGSIKVGSSQTSSVTLSNSGGSDLNVMQATMSGAGFSMSNLALPLTLHAGSTASITITFAPPGSGSFSGSVTFATTSNQENSSVVLKFAGDGVAQSQGTLSPNPSSLAFGSVQVGSNGTKTETLTNTGSAAVTISQATPSGAGFSVSGLFLPVTLNANQSVSFSVIFAPATGGAVSGNLSIVSDASNSPLNIPLSATGLAAGTLTATPSSVSFGNVTVGSHQNVAVTVTNTGGVSVTVSSATATGSGFSFTGPGLPATINAGQSATFNAIFTPSAAGAATGTLTINSNASNPTLSVPLSGTGVAQGQLGSNPTNFSFGNIQVGTSKSLSGTLTNSGGSSLTISAASASGPGFSVSGLSLPLTLNAGQSTSFTVSFAPTAGGAVSGNVSITSTASNLSIPLSGTGVTQGALTANPNSLAFGSVTVGSNSSLSETLTNTGGTSLTISAASASGTGFSMSGLTLPVTLNAGQSASFTVTFAPTASGTVSGSVSVTSNGGNPNLSIALTGTGVAQGALTPNPSSLAFGSVTVGTSKSLSETLTNTGGSSLTISAASASGTGLSLSGLTLPVTLNAGQSTAFTVTFAPTTGGAVSGNVSITSTASNLSIPLSGTGVTQGTLTPNPTSLGFGSVTVGSSSSVSETLTNTGGTSLTISAASASGTGFSISGLTLPVTLNAGQSTSFTVTFAPASGGAASGSVSITSNGSNPNLSISLSGTGVTQGTLTPNPTSLAFGSVTTGTSQSLSETLTNTGGSSLTISGASASGTGFSLSGLTLPVTLNAGQSTSVTVSFAPTASGTVSGNVSITSNGGNPNVSIPLSGTGVTPGTLSPNPSSLAFGSVQVGNSTNLSETMTNTGGSPVTISQANVTGAVFSISGLTLPITLNANQSVTFTATFTPTGPGAASGSLSVVSNASNSPLTVALSGTGTAAGQLAVSPTSLSFGNVVVGSNAALSGSLTASGASVTVSSASLNNGEFVLSGISLPTTLAAGQSTPFTVTFTPSASGATSASLSFSSNASNSPAVQTMTGTGTAPTPHTVDLTWNPSSGAVGYNVYRGAVSGGPYTMINTSLDGTTAYTDNTVVSGQTYFYVATAVDGNSNESGYSNQAQAIIPTP
jgi:Abnormal spindle-like microcephaly-assoc'd, ASPM-SPD-2-Hydin